MVDMERYFYYSLVMLLMTTCTGTTNISTDQTALLAFKSHITSDPHEFLSKNWSSSSAAISSVCSWIGVKCSFRHQRVIALNISNLGLSGTISPQLGNLSFLVSLDMSNNNFLGNLPRDLSRLRRLKVVILGSNNFSGEIPIWFGGHFPKLQIMALYGNHFTGLIPSSISNLSKLEELYLDGNFLNGKVPQQIGNLRSLKFLNLTHNQLIGSIPSNIFNISTLEYVDFAFNNLSGTLPVDICPHHLPSLKGIDLSFNQLYGKIPSSLSQCSQLEILSLTTNNFNGAIPREIGNLELLERLYLGSNNLEGTIPEEIGNLRNLKEFDIGYNQITGSIPKEIGNLTMLNYLWFSFNFLTGEIPQEISNLHKLETLESKFNELNGSIPIGIFNLSKLSAVVFGFNHLTGNLPSNICHQLPNLKILVVNRNNISGVIPTSIGNCSKLTILSLASNQFTGSIPNSLGNLVLLERLYLLNNSLTSDPTSLELDFITSLTNCKFLKTLEIAENPLNGALPISIGNLSTSLEKFTAGTSNIKGPIPSEIGNLSNLILISLKDNHLTGVIPRAIKDLQNLQMLSLRQNKLSGNLDNFCNMHRLAELYLSQNQISGTIPSCFGNMTSLRKLYLRFNLLTSTIPRGLWKLRDLLALDLASNSLNGSLPLEIGNMKAMILIDMSMNQISGDIPRTIGDLQNLQNLSLADNRLQGSIPDSFGNMISLTSLNLSNNSLSGSIPKSMEKLQYLQFLDLSFNHLRGEIPSGGRFENFTSDSFVSNDALCCEDPKFLVPRCRSDKPPKYRGPLHEVLLLTFIPLSIAIVTVFSLAFALLRYQRKNKAANWLPAVAQPKGRLSYDQLVQATSGYSDSNFLGSGSFGSVYKGILSDGRFVAIKVFNLQLEGSIKSFEVECEALRDLRHRNLLKIINSCSTHDFKALVLEYMSNGNLEKWLYSHDDYFLTILQRLDIMIDVANALQYLHHECPKPIIHCDLKPSNVLIDQDMVAHVTDFGIAKFLGNKESFVLTKTLATLGYIAPEYGLEGLVSTACDVYSYGIMLMEVFTRRRPSDEMFDGDLNLKSWVNESMPDAILQIIDTDLLKPTEEHFTEKLECLSLIMELALNCVPESPKQRPSMKVVVDTLQKIKQKYLECHGGK